MKPSQWRKTASLTAAAIATTLTMHSYAATLDPTNGIDLGGTSFFDGFGATKPGLTYLGYYKYSAANHIVDNNGNDSAAFKDPKIDAVTVVNSFAYTTHETFFNGKALLGGIVLLPYVKLHSSFASDSPLTLSSSGSGLGDLTFGPYLQFMPVIMGGRPVFSQRFELDMIAPTGKYDSSKNINLGSGFWSINPYWAATWLPTPKTEVSWRLNYLYNLTNNDPNGLPPTVTSTKAGQAFYANFATSYAVLPNLHVGLNGYYFKQLSNDTYHYADGTSDSGALFGDGGKSTLFAIGPGVNWMFNQHNIWDFNLYVQTDSRNNTRGSLLNVHWIHSF